MSLYEFLVPVTPEQAKAYEALVRHRQSGGFFSSCCAKWDTAPHTDWEAADVDYYENGIQLGRPLLGDSDFATVAKAYCSYGRSVELTAKLCGILLPLTEDTAVRDWLKANIYKTIVLVNDNEF